MTLTLQMAGFRAVILGDPFKITMRRTFVVVPPGRTATFSGS